MSGEHRLTQLTPLVRRLVASNAGPFTFTGTCTYIVGRGTVTIIDPGPADPEHSAAILAAVAGETVGAIAITHTHKDHAPGAVRLRDRTGAPVYGPPAVQASPGGDLLGQSLDAVHDRGYAPDVILSEDASIEAPDHVLHAVETPGHTRHHLAFALPGEGALFSGDHVMAWSTTVVAPPDGSMGDYMASLSKLLARGETVYWPGHGGPVRDPPRFVRALLHHRRQREQAILQRLRAGDGTPDTIVRQIYQGLAPALKRAAALSVLAHLHDLRDRGLVDAVEDGSGMLWRVGDQPSGS